MTPAPAPYPPDTRAKGWRFELDYERIEQSDTWALASPQQRPWLLMLWMTAWKQQPCGSLPASDELIAARIGMELAQFRAHRDILLRGWVAHSDGRLYHPVITEQVLGLMAVRSSAAERKRRHDERRRNASVRVSNALPTTPEPEPEPEPYVTPITPETAHTPAGAREPDPSVSPISVPVAVCIALRQHNVHRVNANHPKLVELCQDGATVDDFLAVLPRALDKTDPFAWLVAAVEGRRKSGYQLPVVAQSAPSAQLTLVGGQVRRPVAPEWVQRRTARALEAYGRHADINRWDLPPDHPQYPANAAQKEPSHAAAALG